MLFQVWSSSGDGLKAGPRFRLLGDAIRFTNANAMEASFAIRGPSGNWVHIQARGRS